MLENRREIIISLVLKEHPVGLKPRQPSFKTNEIGLRVPLRAYGACVVRFLFLLWVFLRFLYFFSSFLCSVFLRVLPYSYFLMFNCSFFFSLFCLPDVFPVFFVGYIHSDFLPGVFYSRDQIFFFKKRHSAFPPSILQVATYLVLTLQL